MKLDLGFRAETPEEAQEQAEAWIAAEPNVESGKVLSIEPSECCGWAVLVALVFRGGEQQDLGLSA